MVDTCFLGANTPQGFRSEYATLQTDPRIRRLLILKGGPGCGQSTLMKTLAARAEECGWAVERVLCSSDPASLDGVIVPELGLAIVDGTAPHQGVTQYTQKVRKTRHDFSKCLLFPLLAL